jgi:hypothetical protein
LVGQGKAVVSSEDSLTVEWALKAIREGKTATLYVKKPVLQAILKQYWTPKRLEFAGMKPISAEQSAKVKADLNVDINGYANSVVCPRCGPDGPSMPAASQSLLSYSIEGSPELG